MPDRQEDENGDVMAGDRRLSRPDSALPDWYLPDASYRPIPIAWFAGALVLQVIAMPTIFVTMIGFGPTLTIGVSTLASAVIWLLSWQRGIRTASRAWQIATLVMLGFFLALNCLAALT